MYSLLLLLEYSITWAAWEGEGGGVKAVGAQRGVGGDIAGREGGAGGGEERGGDGGREAAAAAGKEGSTRGRTEGR